MHSLFTLFLAFLGLGFLVFIHELGHFFMARRVGMKVEAFGIGFGKPIYSWEYKGVKWNLCWLPFGGYVRIAGMEKDGGKDPYKIADGFFGKKPKERIKVALAGPLVNILFSFVAFFLIWATGGREKPFSEYTHFIGWVDPSSKLHEEGIDPGDEIQSINGDHFSSYKDLLYAVALGSKSIQLSGEKIDYFSSKREPFKFSLDSRNGLESFELNSFLPARYLIYRGENTYLPLGLQKNDRILWVDGKFVFSLPQMSDILNQSRALLTVKRGNLTFLTRIPRLKISDLRLDESFKGELDDWQHEAELGKKTADLFFIPYQISQGCTVEEIIPYLDESAEETVFTSSSKESSEIALEKGDQILAVWGKKISSSVELMQSLQIKEALIIVQREKPAEPPLLWNLADKEFLDSFSPTDLQRLTNRIGVDNAPFSVGNLALLPPVSPKPLSELSLPQETREKFLKAISAQKREIEKISNARERERALSEFEKNQQKVMLGIPLQNLYDRIVIYNPSPFTLFGDVFEEITHTLVALFSGSLSPKNLAGPVGIVQVIQQGWSEGVKEALFWMGLISLNLAILNLLPIPVLDGGHVCFSLVEAVTKRPINLKLMERLTIPFVILLIVLFIYFTFQDLSRIFYHFFK